MDGPADVGVNSEVIVDLQALEAGRVSSKIIGEPNAFVEDSSENKGVWISSSANGRRIVICEGVKVAFCQLVDGHDRSAEVNQVLHNLVLLIARYISNSICNQNLTSECSASDSGAKGQCERILPLRVLKYVVLAEDGPSKFAET